MLRTLTLLLLATPLAAAPSASIADGKIVVAGVTSTKGLSVIVAEGTEDEIASRPPVSGEWTTAEGKAIFTPKYPLRPGTKYRIASPDTAVTITAPVAARPKTAKLMHIYPTATELPANVLRFYLEFDHPMPRGGSYKYVSLFNDKGKKDPLPFLEIDDELWNPDQSQLTLLVDPGRIKKEVKPRIDLGPVFEPGKKYTLVVSGKWPTLSGEPLGKDVTKTIAATAPIGDGLDPKAWKLTPPADGKGSLTITFARPMDHPLLARCLTVVDPAGGAVNGTGEPTDQDRGWTFRPATPWAPGAYTLRVDPVFEDVCGNRVGRPFEVDLLKPDHKEIKAERVELPFVVAR
jgi:hypothetical protein